MASPQDQGIAAAVGPHADLELAQHPPRGSVRRAAPGVGTPAASHPVPVATRNAPVAERLREAADILLAQGDGPFRAAAYRRAADAILDLRDDLADIAASGGRPALEAIPGVGLSIAGAITEMLATGRWSYLERLRGGAEPERLFRLVPGIGQALARRIHEMLHIETLEGLEAAAHDGRLARLPGFGERRAAMVRGALADRLRPTLPLGPADERSVALLLEVDREYRERAARGELPRIAPKRFNPSGEAWLPVLHTRRGDWHLTALHSNTALAYRLGKVEDWTVLHFHRDGLSEGRRTVVTETQGAARGRRVVRGREDEEAAPGCDRPNTAAPHDEGAPP
jgi:hypothetical protein